MTDYLQPLPGESICEFSRRLWDGLDVELRSRCVDALRNDGKFMSCAHEVRKSIRADPDEWVLPYHRFWGMRVRNLLRDTAADRVLPSENWDDYYSAAVEEAVEAP